MKNMKGERAETLGKKEITVDNKVESHTIWNGGDKILLSSDNTNERRGDQAHSHDCGHQSGFLAFGSCSNRVIDG